MRKSIMIGVLLIFLIKVGTAQIPTFDFFLNSSVSESMSYAFEYPDDNYYFCGNRKIDTASWEKGGMIITSDQFGDTSMHFFSFQDTSISLSSLILSGNNLLAFEPILFKTRITNED